MQLKLELTTGPNAGEMRLLGGTGMAFIIGTSAGATWLLPLTADAPGDIRIEPAADGLVAVLHSGTAYLDQRALTTDTPRLLLPGSVLQVCGHQISVQTGVPAALSQDAVAMQPTISSILASGQRLAADPDAETGFQSHGGDGPDDDADWISALTANSPAPREDWASLGQFEPSADKHNDLPLGPAADASRAFLPDDWAGSTATIAASSDQQNRVMQASLPGTTLEAVQAKPGEPMNDGLALAAFLRGAGLSAEELGRPLPDRMEALGEMLRTALHAIARLEETQSRFETELGLSTALPHAATRQADATMLAVAQSPDRALQAIQARIADLETSTSALWSGTMTFAQNARDRIDPDVVEAVSAAAGGMRARLLRSGAAWGTFRARYTEQDPLSTEALAAAIRQAKSANTLEEPAQNTKDRTK